MGILRRKLGIGIPRNSRGRKRRGIGADGGAQSISRNLHDPLILHAASSSVRAAAGGRVRCVHAPPSRSLLRTRACARSLLSRAHP